MTNFTVTQYEQWIIEVLRQEIRDKKGRPFDLIIHHAGGNSPIQVMRTEIITAQNGKVDILKSFR